MPPVTQSGAAPRPPRRFLSTCARRGTASGAATYSCTMSWRGFADCMKLSADFSHSQSAVAAASSLSVENSTSSPLSSDCATTDPSPCWTSFIRETDMQIVRFARNVSVSAASFAPMYSALI
eukprot:Polyplicarium_translucidae@DN1199_c0_g1_i1.p1